MKRLFVLVVIILSCTKTFTQTLVTQFSLPGKPVSFGCLSVNDSILFTYTDQLFAGDVIKSQWITTQLSPSWVATKYPYAIVQSDTTFFYYLDGPKKQPELHGKIVVNGVSRELEKAIPIDGAILSRYIDNNLFIVTLNTEGNRIEILEIEGLHIVKKDTYMLPVNLLNYANRDFPIEFYRDDHSINSFKGRGKVKIFKGQMLTVVIDQPFKNLNSRTKEYQTIVVTFDGANVTPTTTFLPLFGTKHFTSFLADKKLFRLAIHKKSMDVSIYDLPSAVLLKTESLYGNAKYLNVMVRHSRERLEGGSVRRKRLLREARKSASTLFIKKYDSVFMMQSGIYRIEKDPIIIPGGFLPAVAFAIIQVAARSQQEAIGTNSYFSSQIASTMGELQFGDTKILSARSALDYFELSEFAVTRPLVNKGYWRHKNGILSLYHNAFLKQYYLYFFDDVASSETK